MAVLGTPSFAEVLDTTNPSTTVTQPAGSDRVLVAWVMSEDPSISGAITAMTFDGVAMTARGGGPIAAGSFNARIACFEMLEADLPASDGDYTLAVNSNGVNLDRTHIGWCWLSGRNQGAPEMSGSDNGTDVTSLSVSGAVSDDSDVVYAIVGASALVNLTPAIDSGDTVTERWDANIEGGGAHSGLATVTITTGATVAASWSHNTNSTAMIAVAYAPAAGGGGSTENMNADLNTSAFNVTGTASVTYQILADLVTNSFISDGSIDVSGDTTEEMVASLLWGITPEDGDSLDIYVAGFSDLTAGFEASGTETAVDLTNIAATLAWSATLTNSQTNFVREIEGEAATSAFNSFAGLGFLLNSTLEWGARLEGTPSGNIDLTTGLELLKRDAKIVRNGKDFVADIIRSIVRRY